MPVLAVFSALTAHSQPTASATIAAGTYMALIVLIARLYRGYRKRGAAWRGPLKLCLSFALLALAIPMCNRQWLATILPATATTRADLFAHVPLGVAESGYPTLESARPAARGAMASTEQNYSDTDFEEQFFDGNAAVTEPQPEPTPAAPRAKR